MVYAWLLVRTLGCDRNSLYLAEAKKQILLSESRHLFQNPRGRQQGPGTKGKRNVRTLLSQLHSSPWVSYLHGRTNQPRDPRFKRLLRERLGSLSPSSEFSGRASDGFTSFYPD